MTTTEDIIAELDGELDDGQWGDLRLRRVEDGVALEREDDWGDWQELWRASSVAAALERLITPSEPLVIDGDAARSLRASSPRLDRLALLRADPMLKPHAKAWRAYQNARKHSPPPCAASTDGDNTMNLSTINQYPGENLTLKANAYLVATSPAHAALPLRDQVFAAGQFVRKLTLASTPNGGGVRLAATTPTGAPAPADEDPAITALRNWLASGKEIIEAARKAKPGLYVQLLAQALPLPGKKEIADAGGNLPDSLKKSINDTHDAQGLSQHGADLDLRFSQGRNRIEKAVFVLAASDPIFAKLDLREQTFRASQALRSRRVIE